MATFIKQFHEIGIDDVPLVGGKNASLGEMIPLCRTVEEGIRVQQEMAKHGLERGRNGLELYVMCEIPSNVISASAFLGDDRSGQNNAGV